MLVPEGPVCVFHKLLISWDFFFYRQQSGRVYVGWCKKEKKKHSESVNSVDGDMLLMKEVTGEWPDCFRLEVRLE